MAEFPISKVIKQLEPVSNSVRKRSLSRRRTDGTFSRSDFAYDTVRDAHVCPAGKELHKRRRVFALRDPAVLYRASKFDCDACALKPEHASAQSSTLIHEAARDKARAIAETEAYVVSRRERKIVEMFFCPSQAYPQDRPIKASWSKWSQR